MSASAAILHAQITSNSKLSATATRIADSDEQSRQASSRIVAAETSPDSDQDDCFVDAFEEFDSAFNFPSNAAKSNADVTADVRIDSAYAKLLAADKKRIFGDDEASRHELNVRLRETRDILELALSNEFARAIDLCSEKSQIVDTFQNLIARADIELYASLAHATLSFLRAALTLEGIDMQSALTNIGKSLQVSSQSRRQVNGAAQFLARFLCRPNYNQYTDDEVHAELVYCESMLLMSLISFLADQSLVCLVKGALRIRSAYAHYKECAYILESRKNWSSEEAKRHFESGVRMGLGIFNLLMSYLPRRVLRFLEYVGFSGDRSLGVGELEKSVQLKDGLRSVFSSLSILTYHSYVESLFGLGDYDIEKVEETIVNSTLTKFPNSAFYHLFHGRFNQMTGNLDAALVDYQACINSQSDWKQFHSLCHWEMMWCHAVKMNWLEAASYADLLRFNSKWSPASYTYQYATFLYAKLVDDDRGINISANTQTKDSNNNLSAADISANIERIIKRVPELRIRYAGKTIPAEKFAITRAAKFLKQDNRLTLPALEFLYIWNVFATLKNNPIQVRKLLARIELEIDYMEQHSKVNDENSSDSGASSLSSSAANTSLPNTDDVCLALLLKAMCLKHLNELSKAEQCLMRIIDSEQSIKTDTFLLPHAAMEISLLKITAKQYVEAMEWIKIAKSNYTGYLLETLVHFRLHAASRAVRHGMNMKDDSTLTKDDDASIYSIEMMR